MTYTAITAATANGPLSSTAYNAQVKGNIEHLADPPRARVTQSATQSIPISTSTEVTFTAEAFDAFNMHSVSVNTSRLTITQAGLYRVDGVVAFAANSSGSIRRAFIQNSGTAVDGSSSITAPGTNSIAVAIPSTLVYCNVGDYIELVALHDATAAVSTVVSGSLRSALQVCWAGLS